MIQCVIRHVAKCPFCGNVLAIDVAIGEIVYNPNRLFTTELRPRLDGPCEHLACFWVWLAYHSIGPDGSASSDVKRMKNSVWEHDHGLYDVHFDLKSHQQLTSYLGTYAAGTSPRSSNYLPDELRPTTEHQLVVTCSPEEPDASHDYGVLGREGDDVIGFRLHGSTIFAPDAGQTMCEIRRQVRRYAETFMA